MVVEDALGHQTRTQYNALGYRTIVTDANGTVTHYTYDGLNRPVEIEYVGEGTVQYAYDAIGHRTAMTDAVGETLYVYDELGRLVQVDDPITGTVQYVYDLAGNRTQLIYPTGQIVTYTYDADNRLAQVEDWDGGMTTYDYDDAGQLITTTLPNGIVSVNSYDVAGRLVGLTHTASSGILSGYSYELDGVGNRVSAVETLTDTTRTIAYTYDALNRLTEAEYDDGKLFQYAYDAVGNRTYYTETITQTAVTTYAYDAANRLTNVNGVAYTYDNNGSLTNDGLFTYVWNVAGQLVGVENVTVTVVYTYNGDGVRVAQSADGAVTSWVQDVVSFGLPQVLVETSGSEMVLYLYGLGHLAQTKDDHSEWFLSDALGSVRRIVANDGSTILSQEYDPYGQIVGTSGSSDSTFGYTGEQWDGSTGLVFLRARWYDPRTGRFVSRDAFPGYTTRPQTLHPYVYARNNPINLVDHSGYDSGGVGTNELGWQQIQLAFHILLELPPWAIPLAVPIILMVFTEVYQPETLPPIVQPYPAPVAPTTVPKTGPCPGESPKPSNPSNDRDPQRSPSPSVEPPPIPVPPLGPDFSYDPQPQGEPQPEPTSSPKPTGTPTPENGKVYQFGRLNAQGQLQFKNGPDQDDFDGVSVALGDLCGSPATCLPAMFNQRLPDSRDFYRETTIGELAGRGFVVTPNGHLQQFPWPHASVTHPDQKRRPNGALEWNRGIKNQFATAFSKAQPVLSPY